MRRSRSLSGMDVSSRSRRNSRGGGGGSGATTPPDDTEQNNSLRTSLRFQAEVQRLATARAAETMENIKVPATSTPYPA